MRFPVYDWSQVGTQKQLEEDPYRRKELAGLIGEPVHVCS